MHDIKLSLELKNGGVEIESASVDSSVSKDAVFLNLDKVDALNRVVREKAGGCVKVLEEIRDFKSGIYQLLFECKRLDMEGEDASNRVRDLQLLRVTSEVNQVCVLSSDASKRAFARGENQSNSHFWCSSLQILARPAGSPLWRCSKWKRKCSTICCCTRSL